MRQVLLIFARNPRLGQVKTRLAATMGDEAALHIYLFLLEKTRQAALELAAERWLFYSDTIEAGDAWPEQAFRKFVQQGPELGARMEQAFQQAFAAGAGKAVIIGTDCPELTGALLEQAFVALEQADVVLGPALDGGYYLLGMKALLPALFRDMPWSTAAVCAETQRRAADAGKTVAVLPVLRDVDTEEDWRNAACQTAITGKTTTSRSP